MTNWHAPPELIGEYLIGGVDDPTAASIEAHAIDCSECRSVIARRSDPTATSDSWRSIEQAVDAQAMSPLQRAAGRTGLSDREIRTLAPTVSLQLAWAVAAFLALLCAAVLARGVGGTEGSLARLAFLTLAPLAPLAAVASALSNAGEPAPEISTATPASQLRIGAVRATTSMFGAVLLGLAASAVLPGNWLSAVTWLLPALALSILGALIAGRVAPTVAGIWLAAAWMTAVVVAARLTDDRFAAFRTSAQLVYLVMLCAAGALIALRPDSFQLRRIR